MKATGIVRPIDNLGRVVLPKSLRDAYNLNLKDPVEIFTDENSIILRKYEPSCIFCGETSNVVIFKDKKICDDCLNEIKNGAFSVF